MKHTILHRNLEDSNGRIRKTVMVKEFSTFVAELEGLSSVPEENG